MISWSCAPPVRGPTRPNGEWRRSWPRSGCGCIPTRPGSCTSTGVREGSTSWASITGCASPCGGRAAGICTSGPPSGRWIDPLQDPRPHPPALRRCRPQGHRRAVPQPRAAGLGRLLPDRELDPEVRPHRQLRAVAARPAGQRQARPAGINWGQPVRPRWVRSLGVYELVGSVRHGAAHALR